MACALAWLLGACQAVGSGAPRTMPFWAMGPLDAAGLSPAEASSSGAASAQVARSDATLLSFEERFQGPRLNPLMWSMRAQDGLIQVGGGEVVVAGGPAAGVYPLLATLGEVWPSVGPFRLSLNYRLQGAPAGVALMLLEGSLPPAGVALQPLFRLEGQAGGAIQASVLGPDGQWRSAVAPHGGEARPASAPHALRLEGDAEGRLRVLVDGAELLLAPVAQRPDGLALAALQPELSLPAWPEWRLSALQSGGLQEAAPSGPAPTPFPTPTPVPTPKAALPATPPPSPPVASPSPVPKANPSPSPLADPSPSPLASPSPSPLASASPSPLASPSPSPQLSPSPSPQVSPDESASEGGREGN